MKLGATYTDKITGFTGVAVAHIEYLSGCNQTELQPKVDKEGKKVAIEWFDDQRLVEQEVEIFTLQNDNNGGGTPPTSRSGAMA